MTDIPTVLVCVIRLEDEGEYFYEVVAFRLASHDDVTRFIRMYAMLTLSPNQQTQYSHASKNTDNHGGQPNIRQNGHSILEAGATTGKSVEEHHRESKQAETRKDQVNNNNSTKIANREENLLQVPVRKSRSVLFQSMDDSSLLKSDNRRQQSRKTTRSPTLMYNGEFDGRPSSRSETSKKVDSKLKTTRTSHFVASVQNVDKNVNSNPADNEVQLRNVGTMTPSMSSDRNGRIVNDSQQRKIRWERPSDYELYCHRTRVYMSDDVGMADVSCQAVISSASYDNTSQANDIGIYSDVNKRQREAAKSNISANDNSLRSRANNETFANVINDREESSEKTSFHRRTYQDNERNYLDVEEGRKNDDNEYRIETYVLPKASNSTSANKNKHIFTDDDELDHGFPFETSRMTYPYVHAIINPSDSDQTSVSDIVFNSLPRKFQRDDSGWDSNSFDTLIEDKSAENETADPFLKYTKKSSVRSVNAVRKKSVKIDPASLNPTKVRIRPSSMHLVSQDDKFQKVRGKDDWHSDDDQTVKFRRNIYSSSSSGKESSSTNKFNNDSKYPFESRPESNLNSENRSGYRGDDQSTLSNGKGNNKRFDKLGDEYEGNGRQTPSRIFKGQDSISPLSNEEDHLRFSNAGGGSVQARERSRKSYIFDEPIREKDHSKRSGRQLKSMTSMAERDQNDSRRPKISSEIYNISDFYPASSMRRSESLDHERSDRSVITYLPIQDMQIRDTGLIKKIEQGRRRLFPHAPDKVSLKGRIFDATAYKQRTPKVTDQVPRQYTISQESKDHQDEQNSTLSRGQRSDGNTSGGLLEKNWPHSEKGYASFGDYNSSGGGSDLEASRRLPTRRTASSVIDNDDPRLYRMGQRRVKPSKKGHDLTAGSRVYRSENERLKNKNNDLWSSGVTRDGRRSVLNERDEGVSRSGFRELHRSHSVSRDERPISRHGARI